MYSFEGESVLCELLGFVVLWGASYWKGLPQLHLDYTSAQTEKAIIRRITKAGLFRFATAISLVLFQCILASEESRSRWATPLITIGVFALAHSSNHADLTNPSRPSYSLLAPKSWNMPKFDPKEPVFLVAASVMTTGMLLWSGPSLGISLVGFVLLISGVAFFAFLSRAARTSEEISEKTASDDTRHFIRSLASYSGGFTFFLLVLAASKMQYALNLLVLLEVLLRASQAFGLILFASENPLAASSTVTAASIGASVFSNVTVNLVPSLLAFAGSVSQMVATSPKSNEKRLLLFGFLFVPGILLPLVSNTTLAPSALKESIVDPLASLPATAFAQAHPVQKLHQKWYKYQQEKVAKQSQTLKDAVCEYTRRYGRRPPPGFDKWFNYARDNNYLLIDEFDQLMGGMEPFWQVTPTDLYARMKSAAQAGQITEVEVIGNQVTRRSSDHWYAEPIVHWFENFGYLDLLPDFNFTMNVYDEPRTVFHPEHLQQSQNDDHDLALEETRNEIKWSDAHQHPLWSAIAPSCPNQGRPEINDESAYQYSTNGIDFMDGSGSSQDVCVSSSLRMDHGFFVAPTSMFMTHNVVPIFSQAAPKRFTDIIYPTPFYWNSFDGERKDNKDDSPWEAKNPQAYWAGGSTGGQATEENWRHLHRNRITLMVSPNSTESVSLLQRTKFGKWQSLKSLWARVSNYFNIQITRLVQCEPEACKEMEESFHLGVAPGSAFLHYKYALDIDGNSYTGRYYRLLRSNTCVIKSTIFREWHDDILVPWVHYIPLSNGAKEFGEMMRFLVDEPEGDAIGQSIAVNGKDWANRALRKIDMEVYALRVFMEYARLFDEERETNGFTMDTK